MKPPLAKGRPDDFQTPPIALKPLYPYLPKDWTIWEPAAGKRNLVNELAHRKYKVIGTDVIDKPAHDFLDGEPGIKWDCIVTNPPFSLKQRFLERCYRLAYIGSDNNSAKDVGSFLRNCLAPLITKYDCGVVIIHHTNKISRDPDKQSTEYAYLGAGSAEWANWSRAIIALNKTDVDNLYELIAAKRGARLKWRTADGESLTMKRYIGHSKRPDTICWVEMAIADAEELRANNGKRAEDVLKHVPATGLIAKDDLIKTAQRNGIGKHRCPGLIAELIENGRLFECKVPRNNARPKILLSRTSLVLPANLTFETCIQNSQGHFSLPNNEAKKEL